MLHLAAQNWDIEIDPENGSLFRKCRYQGAMIFRDFNLEASAGFPQFGASNFPLLPFSNRIKNGQFSFEGIDVSLPVNAPDQIHPLHGIGWLNTWDITETSETSILLSQVYDAGDWPWSYKALQRIGVDGPKLKLGLEVTNTSPTNMPCGLGFHPYFPDLDEAYIAFDSDGVWLADEDVLPVSHVVSPTGFNFSRPQRLKRYRLDHCFTGTNRAEISWANTDKTIQINSSAELSRAAVFTNHAENYFCFEPISHTHNALNMDDPVAEGMKILEPGETAAVWTEFKISSADLI